MGVYIENMEMPTTYPLTVTIYPDGQVLSETVGVKDVGTAVTVPPHGRLIDADALMMDIRKNSVSYFADDFAHEWVDPQPTIIPAEEGET